VRLLFAVLFLALIVVDSAAIAAPPAECAGKFVGSWMVTVLATGQTYPATISPDGSTHVTCPFCNPTGSWTCSGDTIMIRAPAAVSHTLAPDGQSMSGGCCRLTRLGAAGAPPQAHAAAPRATLEPPAEPGLREGPSGGRLHQRAQKEALDIFYSTLLSATEKWVTRTEYNVALKEKLVRAARRMERAAEAGRWRELQHEYETVKPLIAEARQRGLKLNRKFDVFFQ
jgi:hypothetical protein